MIKLLYPDVITSIVAADIGGQYVHFIFIFVTRILTSV